MDKSYTLYHMNSRQILLEDLKAAKTFSQRFRGLMGRNLADSEGLLITPCNSIHCFFMKIPIDVLFINKEARVVRKIESLKPWRVSPIVRGAIAVIEGPAGAFQNVASGDLIEVEENRPE